MPEILAQRLYIKSLELIKILEERVEKLEAELHLLKTSGIIEVAVRNPNVMEYMRHWEGRAEAAEAKLAKAVGALEFYADADNYEDQHKPESCGCCYYLHDAEIKEDEGAKARTALAELKGQDDE